MANIYYIQTTTQITGQFSYTLILLEPKVISICHQYKVRQFCTPMQFDHALYCWLTNLTSHLEIPKKDHGQFQKLKVDYSI